MLLRLTVIVLGALLLWGTCAAGQTPNGSVPQLVILNCADESSMEAVIGRVAEAGGIARHIFPTHVLIAELNAPAAQELLRDPRVELVTDGYADPSAVPVEYGRMARDAVAAWNQLLVMPSPAPEELYGPEDMPGMPLVDDALEAPDEGVGARGRIGGAPAPPGAASWQTSEYLMGSVIVSLVFVESNGAIDTQTENWTSGEEANVVAECLAGANWWISQYPYAASPLSFTWVYNYARQTGYEPINRSSSDDGLWIAEALTGLGYSCTSSTYFSAARNYVNDLRNSNNKDWGYAAFIVDSSVDSDGTFTDGYFAYAYIGGPFMVMTYDNDGWGISRMDQVFSHESGHIFRAGDEYCQAGYSCCSSSAYYGYLRIQNTNCNTGVTCIMNTNAPAVCSVTQQQLGWRDTDADTIADILDVSPTASLTAYVPDPTSDSTPTYSGSASVSFYPNQLNPGYDVTVNRIAGVEYRVDGGSWQACTASDGAFNSGTEAFTFTTSALSGGAHTFEVRAVDTAGNATPSPYPTDTLTINAHSLTVTAGASPTTVASSGSSSLSASFSDSSGHGIATWSWTDNGGGGSFSPSATVQNPTYNAPTNLSDGDVIVLLTVTGTCNGPSPISNSDSVSVTVQPVAHTFQVTANTPSPATVASGGTASLSATYSDSRPAHTVASWSWNDGGAGGSFSPSSNVQNPSYTAPVNTSDSNLVVTLTVNATCNGPSPLGDSDFTSLTVQPVAHTFQVTANAPSPATVASGGTTSLSATYSDSRPAHTVASWSWSDGGAGGSFSPSSSVQNPSYTAPANTGDPDLTVTLTVSATCNGPSPLSDSDSTSLTVQPVAHAFQVTANVPSPVTVTSGGTTSLSATYSDSRAAHTVGSWSWSDGGAGGSFSPSAAVQNPSYTAPISASDQTVTLTVTATCDGLPPIADSDSTSLTVDAPPAADFSASPVTGAAPLIVSFTDLSTGGPTTWLWDFGDGGTSAEENPTHVYTSGGLYSVTLTVSDAAGSDSETKGAYLSVSGRPNADFSAGPLRGRLELSVDFADMSTGSPSSWLWDFGDGETSAEQDPVHQYLKAGRHDVSLTASNPFGADLAQKVGYVWVSFRDVPITPQDPKDHWALNEILACVDAELVQGYPDGMYRPNLPVTRDQMAVYISRGVAGGDANVPAGPAEATFDDVPTDHWAYDCVEYAVSQGIVVGYGDNTYQPDWEVTRAQMAVFIARAIADPLGEEGLAGYTPPLIATFPDVPPDYWSYKHVEFLVSEGVVLGYVDGFYRPGQVMTRDQMAVYIARAFTLP
ncbi:MAG: S-layer homology domain-containing protein [Armatimonadota bacterium]